jgi:hypothetical protein
LNGDKSTNGKVQKSRCKRYKMSEKNEEKNLLERKERFYIGGRWGSASSDGMGTMVRHCE